MQLNKASEQSGILFPDDDKLYTVPLDETAPGHTADVNGGRPSMYDGEPLSRKVIHAPTMTPIRTHTVPPPRLARAAGFSGGRGLLVMTAVAVVVALIALVIGGLGLARRGDIVVNVSGGGTIQNTETDTSEEDRVWLFAIGDYGVSLEYIDEESGEVRGYNVDIINAVCRIARKNCSLVWDVYSHCWETVAGEAPRPGVGLQGGWYDACTAWAITYPRARTFKFTDSISKQSKAVFMVAAEAEPQSFDGRNLTDKVIGFLQGFAENAVCLKRFSGITGNNLAANQVRYYETQQDLLTAVNNGQVDAVFVNEYLDVTLYLQLVSDKLYQCTIGGQAMMVRKDSVLPDWWNPAFQALLDSPEYVNICQGIEDLEVHGSQPGPFPSEHCIGS